MGWFFVGDRGVFRVFISGEKTHSRAFEWLGMDCEWLNGCERLRMDCEWPNGCEWLGMDCEWSNGSEWIENGCEWLGMGWEWLRMARHG
jgi:hypothetical protein